jgi:hypothetical protein
VARNDAPRRLSKAAQSPNRTGPDTAAPGPAPWPVRWLLVLGRGGVDLELIRRSRTFLQWHVITEALANACVRSSIRERFETAQR